MNQEKTQQEEIDLEEDQESGSFIPAPTGTIKINREPIFILAAHNMNGKEIAQELGISQPTVYTALNSEEGAKRVAYHRERLFANKPIRQKMEALSRKAIENLEEFLDQGTSLPIRQRATEYVLDQNLGKAKQSVEVQTSMLSVFMDKLSQAKDVTPENKFELPKDELDNFVDNVVSEHVVGVRNRGES